MFRFGWMRVCGLVAAGMLMAVAPAIAQEEDPWKMESEAGANVFFGATKQTSILAKVTTSYTGTRFQPEGRFIFEYGEAGDAEGGTFLNKRSWLASGALRYITGGSVQPFVDVEGSGAFEKAIDLRTTVGAGAVWTALHREGRLLEFALGGSWERTDPSAVDGVDPEATALGRIAAGVQVEIPFSEDRLKFTFGGRYQPKAFDFDVYTWEVDTGLAFTLTEAVAIKLSLLDRYDSQAVSRGASDNNDGRLYFSLVAGLF